MLVFLPRSCSFRERTMYEMLDRGVILQNTVTIFAIQHPRPQIASMHFEFDGDRCELKTHRKCRLFHFYFGCLLLNLSKLSC